MMMKETLLKFPGENCWVYLIINENSKFINENFLMKYQPGNGNVNSSLSYRDLVT